MGKYKKEMYKKLLAMTQSQKVCCYNKAYQNLFQNKKLKFEKQI